MAEITVQVDSAIATCANHINEISNVANNLGNINTVISNSSNINKVANIDDDVTKVADIDGKVSAVADNETNINTIATDLALDDNSNIITVAGNITDIKTVASISTNVSAVADNETNINAVNSNKTNINTVAGNIANVNTVAGVSSDVTIVAGVSSDVTAVKNNATNINSVASDLTKINSVADDLTNIDNVADDLTNIDSVATNISNVNSVASNATNINAVAGNATNINAVNTNKDNIDVCATNITSIINAPTAASNAAQQAGIATSQANIATQQAALAKQYAEETHGASDVTIANLRASSAYLNYEYPQTDAEGLADVTKYAHSTFDLSKFTVVGSPNITDDGIASGFSSSNYLTASLIPNATKSLIYELSFVTGNDVANLQIPVGTSTDFLGFRIAIVNSNIGISIGKSDASSWQVDGLTLYANTLTNTFYKIKIIWDGTVYTGIVYDINGNVLNTQSFSSNNSIGSFNVLIGNVPQFSYLQYFKGSIDLKQFSITADGVPVFSGNQTGIDTIKPDNYTIVGSPTISADGIASGFSNSNFITCNKPELWNYSNWSVISPYFTPSALSSDEYIVNYMCTINGSDDGINLILTSSGDFQVYCPSSTTGATIFTTYVVRATVGNSYQFRCDYTGSQFKFYYRQKGSEWTLAGAVDRTVNIGTQTNDLTLGGRNTGGSSSASYVFNGSIDLNAFKIYVDSDLVYQPCLKIPYTESKTGSKIVDSAYRDRVSDMYEQFGYAPYYTLDEGTSFTIPQGEIYGLIGQQTLRKSYVSGINRSFLYSDRTLLLTGSCTSGVEVTLPTPFINSNYMLSVPYSAKSATAFTPTQTGDWFAIGEGVL